MHNSKIIGQKYASVPLALAAGGVGATVDRILGLSEKSN